MEMSNRIDPFMRGFGNTAVQLPLADVEWLTDMRIKAKNTYESLGLPTPKQEQWKYTNLRELHKHDFRQAPTEIAVDSAAIFTPIPQIDAHIIMLVNGRFNIFHSKLDDLPDGVTVSGLANIIEENPERLENILDSLSGESSDAMSALNSAYLADGLFLEVQEGVTLDKPIHLVSLALNDTDESIAFHPRNIIHICDNANACLIESHIGIGGNTLNNSISEIWVEAGGNLGHFKNQSEETNAFHIATTHVVIADNAVYNNFTLQLGAKLARNEVNCEIKGSNAQAHVNGAYFANGDQHIDNTSFIDHTVPASNSFETFKGVLDDKATAVFQGKILVRRDAQQTDGQQMSRALLLSRNAEVNAKPELEIYADDVKCSHGSTVGELDDMQLFYLMARGIDEDTARALLVQAFLYEVLDKVPNDDVKQAFHDLIAAKLGDAS